MCLGREKREEYVYRHIFCVLKCLISCNTMDLSVLNDAAYMISKC